MILKCCGVFVALLAALIGFVYNFGHKNLFLAGIVPALVNEQKITELTIPDLQDKIIIVTGANAGLGKSTVKHLVINGAEVIMGCRSMKRCLKAKKEILKDVENLRALGTRDVTKFKIDNLVPMELDLGSFKAVKSFAQKFKAKYDELHSLILNAGIAQVPFALSEDGIQTNMQVNHFSHFYLTQLLLSTIIDSQPATIVSVSSAGHHHTYSEGVRLDLDRINSEDEYYRYFAYGESKLSNILFAQELASKLKRDQKKVYVNAVHPGAVRTDILDDNYYGVQFVKKLVDYFPNTFMFESDLAALTQVYAAVSEDIIDNEITGKYFHPLGEIVETSEHAKNKQLQKNLWRFSGLVLQQKNAT